MNSGFYEHDPFDSPVSINSSSMGVNEDAAQDEFLNNHFIDQVLSKSFLFPWQDEQITRLNKNGKCYWCLGISPSQFRRLMPSKGNEKHDSYHSAILYAQVAMQYTLEQTGLSDGYNTPVSLIVLIADAIQKYNFAIFKNKLLKTGNALKYALEEGDRLVDVFTQARFRLSPELSERVTIIRWQDICNEEYNECVKALTQYSRTNQQFAQLIDDVVQEFIKVRKPNGHFTEEQRMILRDYVLNELPALTHGIVYDGHHCSMIFHPILLSDHMKNDNQRDVMLRLLNYIRNSDELHLNLNGQTPMCEVYDVAITIPLREQYP